MTTVGSPFGIRFRFTAAKHTDGAHRARHGCSPRWFSSGIISAPCDDTARASCGSGAKSEFLTIQAKEFTSTTMFRPISTRSGCLRNHTGVFCTKTLATGIRSPCLNTGKPRAEIPSKKLTLTGVKFYAVRGPAGELAGLPKTGAWCASA